MLIGAYQDGDGNWHSILGNGQLSLGFYWHDSYVVSAYFNIPSDPLVSGSLYAKVTNSGNLGALVDVTFHVPRKVPFIGGRTMGGVDGAVLYIKNDMYRSYGAGWASYRIFRKHHHVGARYNFGTKKVSLMGTNKINGIVSEVRNLRMNNEWVKEIKAFDLVER